MTPHINGARPSGEVWLNPDRPAFALTPGQLATLATLKNTVAGEQARTMFLQQWHQAYCWRHRQIIGVFGSLDVAQFSRRWERDYGDLAEARVATVAPAQRKAA